MHAATPVTLVSDPDAACVSGYYDLSPESPDGRHVVYFRFDEQPAGGSATGRIGVATRGGDDHRALGPSVLGSSQNGVMQQWDDDEHVAFMGGGREDEQAADLGTWIVHRDGETPPRRLPSAIRMFNPVTGRGLGFTRADDHPDWRSAVHLVDFASGEAKQLFTLREAAALHPVAKDLPREQIDRFHMKHTKWAPDGSRFFCVLTNENVFREPNPPDVPRVKAIMLAEGDGSGLRHHTEFGHHPFWSPDSSFVYAFHREQGGGQSLVAYPLDAAPRVLRPGLVGVHPTIGPDGRTIVTDRWQPDPAGGFNASVVLIDIATGSERTLATFRMTDVAQATGSHPHPAWSRQGDRVYFNTNEDGVVRLWAVEV